MLDISVTPKKQAGRGECECECEACSSGAFQEKKEERGETGERGVGDSGTPESSGSISVPVLTCTVRYQNVESTAP